MIFLYIVCGLIVCVSIVTVVNWWRDERDKLGKFITGPSLPLISGSTGPTGPMRALHPSIDPYLAELREHLLTPPLPQGPGEMAERVYTHLNQWVNAQITREALHTVYLEGDLLVEPTHQFVDMSRNEAAPPPGYLEDLMKEEQ